MNILTTTLKRYTSVSLMLRIFIGLVIGAILGLALPGWTGVGILGRIFVSALKGIAPVLVAVLVISSIAKAGRGMGRRFTSLVFIYLLSTFIAAVCAVVGSFLFPVTLELGEVAQSVEVSEGAGSLGDVFTNLLTGMVGNPIAAVANANYIAILFWSIILGVALKTTFKGYVKSISPGKVKAADTMGSSVTLELTNVHIEIDGQTVIKIDKLNEVFIVDGEDLLADIRKNC